MMEILKIDFGRQAAERQKEGFGPDRRGARGGCGPPAGMDAAL